MSGDNGTNPIQKLHERYFPKTLGDVAGLMAHGAETHPHDLEWLEHGIPDHLEHARAHILEFECGREIDQDSGYCHLINAATRLIMAAEVYHRAR